MSVYYTGVADVRQIKQEEGESMVNTELLKREITKKRKNVTEIAAEMGVDKATLYRRIADGKTFTIGEVEKIVAILKLTHKEAISIFFDPDVA